MIKDVRKCQVKVSAVGNGVSIDHLWDGHSKLESTRKISSNREVSLVNTNYLKSGARFLPHLPTVQFTVYKWDVFALSLQCSSTPWFLLFYIHVLLVFFPPKVPERTIQCLPSHHTEWHTGKTYIITGWLCKNVGKVQQHETLAVSHSYRQKGTPKENSTKHNWQLDAWKSQVKLYYRGLEQSNMAERKPTSQTLTVQHTYSRFKRLWHTAATCHRRHNELTLFCLLGPCECLYWLWAPIRKIRASKHLCPSIYSPKISQQYFPLSGLLRHLTAHLCWTKQCCSYRIHYLLSFAINTWMNNNFLTSNEDKTEILQLKQKRNAVK